MTPTLCGAGNAIVDIIAHIEAPFLLEVGADKGTMALVDAARSRAILDALERTGAPMRMSAGGSVANTLAGVAHLGRETGRPVSTAFFGRIGRDTMGARFADETARGGTAMDAALSTDPDGLPTSTSIVLVTPDGERTMFTHLGASARFGINAIPGTTLAAADLCFVEGYLLDTAPGARAVQALAEACPIAITLADPHCVRRHRAAFLDLCRRAAVVFGNAKEMAALSNATAEKGFEWVASHGALAVCTRSADPTLVGRLGFRAAVPVERVAHVMDTTGAGDAFAAGFLHAHLLGADPVQAAQSGAAAAARIIQETGARPALPGA